MIGQFKLMPMTVIWPTSRKPQQGKKEGYYRTPDYCLGNRPRMAKFKVVRNVRLFTSYSINSNLQDETAGQEYKMVPKSGRFANLMEEDLQEITFSTCLSVKYCLWGIVKQIQHGLFREVVKIPGPSVLDE